MYRADDGYLPDHTTETMATVHIGGKNQGKTQPSVISSRSLTTNQSSRPAHMFHSEDENVAFVEDK